MNDILLRAEGLRKDYIVRAGGRKHLLRAVDGVDLSIRRGEVLGLVGESGCGKSTLGRLLLRLTASDGGRILYDGADITNADMRPYRRRMQIVFQDPAGSLDPRMTVGDILTEGMEVHRLGGDRRGRAALAAELLGRVGLRPENLTRYPRAFSGGQQQRIAIARALAVSPEFLVCDEPVSALDVSYQAQIVNLLWELRRDLGLTYLFISHDLSVVRCLSDRVAVMYRGRIVELGPTEALCAAPLHPYTRALLAAVPVPDPALADDGPAEDEPEERTAPEGGCGFFARCPLAVPACAQNAPALREAAPGRFCACIKPGAAE